MVPPPFKGGLPSKCGVIICHRHSQSRDSKSCQVENINHRRAGNTVTLLPHWNMKQERQSDFPMVPELSPDWTPCSSFPQDTLLCLPGQCPTCETYHPRPLRLKFWDCHGSHSTTVAESPPGLTRHSHRHMFILAHQWKWACLLYTTKVGCQGNDSHKSCHMIRRVRNHKHQEFKNRGQIFSLTASFFCWYERNSPVTPTIVICHLSSLVQWQAAADPNISAMFGFHLKAFSFSFILRVFLCVCVCNNLLLLGCGVEWSLGPY